MKSLSLKLTPLALVLSVLTACGGDKPATEAQAPTAEAKTESTQAGTTYKIGVESPYPPFIQLSENGDFEGFDVDLLNEIGKREGFNVTYSPQAWDGIFDALEAGEIDVVASGAFDTEERRAKFGMSNPYHKESMVLIASKDSTATKFEDARGRKVAYSPESAAADVLKNLEGKPLDSAMAKSGSWPVIRSVIQKEAELAIDTSSAYSYYSKQYPEQGLKVIYQDNPTWLDISFVTKKDNTELLAKLNKGLASVQADGTYDKIKAKWFSADSAPTTTTVNGTAQPAQ